MSVMRRFSRASEEPLRSLWQFHVKRECRGTAALNGDAVKNCEFGRSQFFAESGIGFEQALRVDEIRETFGATAGRIASGSDLLTHQIRRTDDSQRDLVDLDRFGRTDS